VHSLTRTHKLPINESSGLPLPHPTQRTRLEVIAVVDGGGDSHGRSRSGGDGTGDAEARAGRGIGGSAGAGGGDIGRENAGGDGGLATEEEVLLDNSGGWCVIGVNSGSDSAVDCTC
jgi:hypothetical protein